MRAAFLALLGSAFSCTTQLEIPSGAEVTCGEGTTCPEGYQCKPALGLCVKTGGDTTPPSVSDVVVRPDNASVTTVIEATFSVTEELARAPAVRLAGTDPDQGHFAESEHDGNRFTFRYVASGVEPEGSPINVVVTLVDRAGNEANDVSLAPVTFDFTPPEVSAITADRVALKQGTSVTVSFSVNEPLDGEPVVTLDSGGSFVHAAGTSFDFTYTASGDEPSGGASVHVNVLDLAGNSAERVAAELLVFDFSGPSLDPSSVQLLPEVDSVHVVRIGGLASVSFATDEPLAALPTVVMDNGTTEVEWTNGTLLGAGASFLHVIEDGHEGVWTLELRDLIDHAGNETDMDPLGDPIVLGSLTIDGEAPVIAISSPTPGARFSAVSGFNNLQVVFDASDVVAGNPSAVEVTLSSDSGAIDLACSHDGSGAYTCPSAPYTVTGTEGEGGHNVMVRARDDAGNEALSATSVLFDFTAPDLVGDAFVRLRAPADCPLRDQDITAVRAGVGIDVSFVVDEMLENLPTVGVGHALVPTIPLSLVEAMAPLYSFELPAVPLPGTIPYPEQLFDLEIGLVDSVGNTATRTPTQAPTRLVFDTTPPTPPDVDTSDRIVYQRVPWGRLGGDPEFTLSSDADAVDSDTTWVVARDGAGPSSVEVGRRAVDSATGSFGQVALSTHDLPRVTLTSYDDACNPSAPVSVRDVTWVATLGFAADGQNPHGFLQRQSIAPYLEQTGETGVSAPTDLTVLYDLDAVTADVRGGGAWEQWLPVTTPPERGDYAGAYDPARGRWIVYGGRNAFDAIVTDTWEWNGNTWARATSLGPSRRERAAMAYDAPRDRILLFGGLLSTTYLSDTWVWNGSQWSEKSPVSRPARRAGHAMAFDGRRGEVVLFGGTDGSDLLDDTWIWDGFTWSQASPATVPPARAEHAMTFDQNTGEILMTGGTDGTNSLTDAWRWSADNWVSATALPAPRAGHAMTFHRGLDRVLAVGGWNEQGSRFEAATLSWSGSAWETVTTDGPWERRGHVLAYDVRIGRAILFGGVDETGVNANGTWELEEDEWVDAAADWPEGRGRTAMAFHENTGEAVLFGGYRNNTGGTVDCGEGAGHVCDWTWGWNGAGWQVRSTTVPSFQRFGHGMAAAGPGLIRVHGGMWDEGPTTAIDDTLEWNGSTWSFAGMHTNRRHTHAFGELANGNSLMFGGYTQSGGSTLYLTNETTLWSGPPFWNIVTPATAPSARSGSALTLVPGLGPLLTGGQTGASSLDVSAEAFLWDGSDWVPLPDMAPGARTGHRTSYDPERQVLLLFGGTSGGSAMGDFWRWDGTDWAPLATGIGPSPRFVHGMSYAGNGKTVLFGGCSGGFTFSCGGAVANDTWVWNGGGMERPAHTWRVRVGAAGFDERAELVDINATVYGAGIGFRGGEARGATLWIWNAGTWHPVDSNTADLDSSDTAAWQLTWQTSIRDAFNRARVGPDQDLHFAVVPVAENGPGDTTRPYGEVRVDYAELVLRYRLP